MERLAGLYSICIQGIEQVDTEGSFGKDSQKALAMFETGKFLLKMWGEKVGISARSARVESYHIALDKDEDRNMVYSVLANVESIWSDGETLSKRYGLGVTAQPTNSSTLQDTTAGTQEQTQSWSKHVWAVKEEQKFALLVTDLGAFIEKLYSIITPEDGSGELVVEVAGKLGEIRLSLDDGARKRAREMIEQWRFQCGVKQYLSDEKRENLLGWIGAVSTEVEYEKTLHERQEGTCSWIFRKGEFLGWWGPMLDADSSNVLWVHGKPGAGKTFLSVSIIEFLKEQSSFPVAYFICTHGDTAKSNPLSILRSWIVQLAAQRVDALKVIENLGKGEPVESRLWQIFSEILDYVRCYLVVDGLDECLKCDTTARAVKEGAVEGFLKNLLQSTRSKGAKVLIISRNDPVIRSGLTAKSSAVSYPPPDYAILLEDTAKDIQSFAHGVVNSVNIKDEVVRKKAFDGLSTGCQGMFLWGRLQGERFEPGMGVSGLQNILSSIPSGLERAYRHDIKRIRGLSTEKQNQVREILRWVLFAVRPLSLRELFHVLAVGDGDRPLRIEDIQSPIDDNYFQSHILELCGPFVEVQNTTPPTGSIGDNTIHLVHSSVKEFLLNAQEGCDQLGLEDFCFATPGISHDILTRTCLLYLLSSSENLGSVKLAFADYCAKNWTAHYQLSTPDGRSRCIDLRRKLLTPGPALDTWTKRGINRYMSLTPLAAASWHGLFDIFKEILMEPDTDPNELTKDYGTALSISILQGHEELVQYLLAREDIDVNLRDDTDRWTPLYTAVACTKESIVQQLLAREDVDVNLPDRYGWTPLFRAAQKGHEEMLRLLLERKDVDISSADDSGCTPLCCAAQLGHKGIVQQLLAREDVDVNRMDKYGQAPLSTAAQGGYDEVFRQLLAREDVNVNSSDVEGKTPLFEAAWGGHEAIIQCLLKRDDVDLNLASNEGWTPLYAAAKNRHEAIVQRLLEREEVDVNYTDKSGRTALSVAAGYPTIANLLLGKGAVDKV